MGSLTERLEADVEHALAAISVVTYALDRDGRVVWQNDAARRWFGDARGAHFTEFVAPEDRRRAQEAFTSKVLGNVKSTDYMVDVVHPDYGQVHVHVSSASLVRGGRVVGVLVILARPPAPLDPVPPGRLTGRQLDVVRLLARGYSTVQIAEELHITVETVRNHIRAIHRELGVHSRVEAVAAAREAGLLAD